MLSKQLIPLGIFALLVLWLVGSWGASVLGDAGASTATSMSTAKASTITTTPAKSATPTATLTPSPTQTETLAPTNTATATATPTASPTPAPTDTRTPAPRPPTPPPTVTPIPELAWQGRIVEQTQTGAGTIGVRAAGLKDHPVILRSGGWQSEPQLTGTKIELGEYSTEFGGLAQGDYIVELVSLAQLTVTLESGYFMLVEFKYDFVNPPEPDP